MAAPDTLTTVVTCISIEEVESDLDHILASFFNDTEQVELSTRHNRSTAGWLILKQALCKLLSQLELAQLDEKDILLKRTETGRPYIEDINVQSLDKQQLIKRLFISISHTRTTAYGMAVYQE